MTFVSLALSPSIPSSPPFQEKMTKDMTRLGFLFSWSQYLQIIPPAMDLAPWE